MQYSPASEAAPGWGRDYQLLYFMCKAMRMLDSGSEIEKVQLSSPRYSCLDDVVVYYKGEGIQDAYAGKYINIQRDHFQCKYHLNSQSYTFEDFRNLTKGWWKDWQKMISEWQQGNPGKSLDQVPYRIYLITSAGWSAENIPLRHGERIHPDFFKKGKDVGKWQEALAVSGQDQQEIFVAFVESLRIQANLTIQSLWRELESICRSNGFSVPNHEKNDSPYLRLAKEIMDDQGERILAAEDLRKRLNRFNLINLAATYPQPARALWNAPDFSDLRSTYGALSDFAVSECFINALREALPSEKLEDRFPGLERGISWDLLISYFKNQPHFNDEDENIVKKLDSFNRLFEAKLECFEPPQDPSFDLALVFKPHLDEKGQSKQPLFRILAALRFADGTIESLRAENHGDDMVVGYSSLMNRSESEVIYSGQARAEDSNADLLNSFFAGLISAASAKRPSDSKFGIDLFLPVELIEIDWGEVLKVDDCGKMVPLWRSGYRFRLRSYDRWANRNLLFQEKREALKKKWHHHSRWVSDSTHSPIQAFLVGREPINGTIEDINLPKQITEQSDHSSVVAVIHAIRIQSPDKRRDFYRAFVGSFVPLVTWWRHDCDSVDEQGRGLSSATADGIEDRQAGGLRDALICKLPLNGEPPKDWCEPAITAAINHGSEEFRDLRALAYNRFGYYGQLITFFDDLLEYKPGIPDPELFRAAELAGLPVAGHEFQRK